MAVDTTDIYPHSINIQPVTFTGFDSAETKLLHLFMKHFTPSARQDETGSIQIEGGSWRAYRLKRSRALQAGEAVALLRADGGQQYLVLGRVRKEG